MQKLQLIKGKSNHRFGALHINYILIFFIPLLIFACLYTYHESVKKKQERPFPHATITNTACHYSQDIIFRWLMLPAGCFINLIYFIVFKWIAMQKALSAYPGDIYQWMHPLGQSSVLGFYAAIGTIDGSGYPSIHGIGAVIFFVALFFIATIMTLVLIDMYNWDPSIIARKSILLK